MVTCNMMMVRVRFFIFMESFLVFFFFFFFLICIFMFNNGFSWMNYVLFIVANSNWIC